MNHRLAVLLFGCIVLFGVDTSAQYRGRCVAQSASKRVATSTEKRGVSLQVGAERIGLYLPLIKDKRIGIVSNHTGRVGNSGTLLADTLLSLGQNVVKLYSPEHGYRGTDDAGASVADGKDTQTGLPVVSLYGKHRKPSRKDLADIDILLFDLQDVGARFYTYISTLHYVMEAAAEAGIPLIVLDRPNPCDHVAGPVLEKDCASFIGMHRIPLLHGLTMGELARMINEEGWLEPASLRCDLTIIRMKGWRHGDAYSLPVPPSPNLKSDKAVAHPDFESQIAVVEETLAEILEGEEKPSILIFNKTDAFSWQPKDEDDLTPRERENYSLEDLRASWMAKMRDECLFISARTGEGMDELKQRLYDRVKAIHVQRYPYNDFLFEDYTDLADNSAE